jgi:hypothetical protein
MLLTPAVSGNRIPSIFVWIPLQTLICRRCGRFVKATPFQFLWSSTATTEDLSNTSAGTSSILTTDANGCTATFTETLTDPAAIVLDLQKKRARMCWRRLRYTRLEHFRRPRNPAVLHVPFLLNAKKNNIINTRKLARPRSTSFKEQDYSSFLLFVLFLSVSPQSGRNVNGPRRWQNSLLHLIVVVIVVVAVELSSPSSPSTIPTSCPVA